MDHPDDSKELLSAAAAENGGDGAAVVQVELDDMMEPNAVVVGDEQLPPLNDAATDAVEAAVAASYHQAHEETADATALVETTESPTSSTPIKSYNNNSNNAMLINNKWAKNGYGATVTKQTGKFSKDESEQVKAAIEEYCNAKQISVARLCSECDHKAELKGAWMDIAKRLPHRSVQSVYRHGIRQCHPFKRGAWSEAECLTLTELVTSMGKKWSAIQAKLNRSADSCRDKYREMSDEYVKGRWKEEETEILQKLIRDHLNQATNGATAGIFDMKDLGKHVESENIQIPWSIISKRMGKRSRLSCFKKWQKLTGIGEEDTAGEGTTKRKLGDDDDNDDPALLMGEHDEQPQPDAKRIKPEPHPDETSRDAVAELAAETVEALELPEVTTATSTTQAV